MVANPPWNWGSYGRRYWSCNRRIVNCATRSIRSKSSRKPRQSPAASIPRPEGMRNVIPRSARRLVVDAGPGQHHALRRALLAAAWGHQGYGLFAAPRAVLIRMSCSLA